MPSMLSTTPPFLSVAFALYRPEKLCPLALALFRVRSFEALVSIGLSVVSRPLPLPDCGLIYTVNNSIPYSKILFCISFFAAAA
jgi:hypothetical protein